MKKVPETSKNTKKQGGRPTKSEELEMERLLRPYFYTTLSAEYIATQPRMPSAKTIRKYFNRFKEDLRTEYLKNKATRDEDTKIRLLAGIDKIIANITSQLVKFSEAILEHKQKHERKVIQLEAQGEESPPYIPDPWLESKYTSLNKFLLESYDMKAAIQVQPTIADGLERKILDNLKNKMSEKK